MGSTRRALTATFTVVALAAATLGVTAAVAQQEDDTGTDPSALLARLGALEADLPAEVPPTAVEFDVEETWGTIDGDAGSVSAVLDTLEPELRRLFIDADDADNAVADAVALVARGWLDVWNGTSVLAQWESHDLAFPIGTRDDDDVATGADEVRGLAETGLDLILLGRGRHFDGYTALRELGQAEPDVQADLDARAAQAETFDSDVRPLVARLLSQPAPTVIVPTERFETTAPGVEPRATAFTLVCLDRDALDDAGGVATDEVVADLQATTPDRVDCPDLPEEIETRTGG